MNKSKKNHSIYVSVYHAARGFRDAFKRERNLRVHICIGNLICYFAYFYKISSVQWAILFMTIGVVVAAELFNSAIEKAVDIATDKLRTDAMHAKDFAAAATLVSALTAVAVGIAIFGNISMIYSALCRIFTSVSALVVLALLLIIDMKLLFINVKKHKRRKI